MYSLPEREIARTFCALFSRRTHQRDLAQFGNGRSRIPALSRSGCGGTPASILPQTNLTYHHHLDSGFDISPPQLGLRNMFSLPPIQLPDIQFPEKFGFDLIKPSPLALERAIPAFPVLLGLTGATVGLYSFLSPNQTIRKFGLCAPTTEKDSISSHVEAFQRSLIYAYGIRNVGTGLATLGLVGFWQFSSICQDPLAALVARKCLGICLITGTVVALGDSWLVGQFAKDQNVLGQAKKEASAASMSHVVTSIFILATGLFLFL
jgi:hypothetical protein